MSCLAIDECMLALGADSGCLYLLSPDGNFEFKAERNFGDNLLGEWQTIPADWIPLSGSELYTTFGEDFFAKNPQLEKVFHCSKSPFLAVAPLIVNQMVIGFMLFLYRSSREQSASTKSYAMTVIHFCAQALERVRLTEREQIARQKAEAASRAKSEFLANISHEIRTPIGVVQGFTDLLIASNGLNPNQKHGISVIRRNTQQLTALIGEVLDISKIEAEKIEVKNSEFCLHELLEDVRTSGHFKAQDKKIDLIFATENLPNMVSSDPIRLRQILVNLVSNAIKFTEKGWVKVHAIFHRPESRLEIRVLDSGVGIPSEWHSTIFEPFIQADSGGRRVVGTGLGLTISKRLALALGGDVWLHSSQPGKGSTFVFSLPCEEIRRVNESSAAIVGGMSAALKDYRILLVEDSPDNQDLISHLLALEGAQVDVADSGVSGVKMAMSRHYNVVLMDIQMPGLNGHEAVSWLRSQGYDRPVAALTAHALSSDKQKSLGEGFDAYLTKPIDRSALIRCLQSLANRRPPGTYTH